MPSSNKAVFFDRDGVLNRPIFNPKTGEFESPHSAAELVMAPGLAALFPPLIRAGYSFFLVSNQPSFAKGKCGMEDLQAVHAALDAELKAAGAIFKEYYYCYHHPQSVVPALLGPCACRKPSPHFLKQAIEKYGLEPGASWMLGDQDTDIACGQGAGVKTILIEAPESAKRRGASRPDFTVPDLASAIGRILS